MKRLTIAMNAVHHWDQLIAGQEVLYLPWKSNKGLIAGLIKGKPMVNKP